MRSRGFIALIVRVVRERRLRLLRIGLLVTAIAALAVVPAAGVPHDNTRIPYTLIEHASQGVVSNYWSRHPEQAPPRAAGLAEARKDGRGRHRTSCGANANRDVFNCDIFGLPQNEESMASCVANTDFVLQGTNDYRGLIDPEGNFTGWHWSIDGGHSVTNEGLLPPVTVPSTPERDLPSGGDPVKFLSGPSCDAYAASLAYNPNDPFGDANGIAVYKSRPEILTSCEPFLEDGVTNPACWPVRRLVAEAAPNHFLDKEWMFVGTQAGQRYVWVTYTDFAIDETAPAGFTGAEIFAVRCDENLVTCSAPISISADPVPDLDTQFSDVTVGPDGRAYITWTEVIGELPDDPDCPEPDCDQIFVHKLRVETAPGSMTFGPERIVYREERAIPFGGFLHGNDFRIATYPKSDVATVDGHQRIFVVWDACKVRLLGGVCEEPQIKLSFSDDDGITWTGPTVISRDGDNYFPTISVDRRQDPKSPAVAVAWFSNSKDVQFHNQQVVQATKVNPFTGEGGGIKELTTATSESEADPLLGGLFIGDYIEAVLVGSRLHVGWNANYRKVPLLGGFLNEPNQPVIPINQQDNYVTITGM
jgi:hypothetical protein